MQSPQRIVESATRKKEPEGGGACGGGGGGGLWAPHCPPGNECWGNGE